MDTFEYYDSFLLQARGQEQADGNATLVGWFVTIPQIGKDLHCLGKRKSRYLVYAVATVQLKQTIYFVILNCGKCLLYVVAFLNNTL